MKLYKVQINSRVMWMKMGFKYQKVASKYRKVLFLQVYFALNFVENLLNFGLQLKDEDI